MLQSCAHLFDLMLMRCLSLQELWGAESLEALLQRDFSDMTASTVQRLRIVMAKYKQGISSRDQVGLPALDPLEANFAAMHASCTDTVILSTPLAILQPA